jgi:hypothetical protein
VSLPGNERVLEERKTFRSGHEALRLVGQGEEPLAATRRHRVTKV